jgi:O-antigen/teichoic acid export membrane protein
MAQIHKNIGFAGISQLLYTLLAFILVPFAARYLGREGYGVYALATTLGFFVALISDLGMSTLLTREISKQKRIAAKLFSYSLSIKALFSVVALLVLTLYLAIGRLDSISIQVIYLFAIASIITSFSQSAFSVFRGFEQIRFETLAVFIDKFLSVAIGISFLLIGLGIRPFISSFLIAAAVKLLLSFAILRKHFIPVRIRVNIKRSFVMLSTSISFGLSIFLAMCYNYLDILMLSVLSSMVHVGLYAASYKLLALTSMIPTVLSIAFLPQFSVVQSNRTRLTELFLKGCKYLILFVFPMLPFVWLMSIPIIYLVFGATYHDSIASLNILVVAAVAQMFNTFFVPLYASVNHQRKIVHFQVFGLAANVLLNAVLIPVFSYIGAAIATVFTEWLILILIIRWALKRFLQFKPLKADFFKYTGKCLVSTLAMTISMIVTQSIFFEATITVPVAAVVYVAFLQLTGCLNVYQLVKKGVRYIFSKPVGERVGI